MKVLAIASNTFKEAVRNRVLYVLLFFALLILVGAWVASTLAIFGADKIVRNMGVASINIISVLIAVFVGIGLVYNDLDKKTIYTIVSKPISRWQFLVGKYLGLLLTIVVNILIMTFFFIALLYFRDFTSEAAMVEVAPGFGVLAHYLASLVKACFLSLGNVVSLGLFSSPITDGVMVASLMTMLEMAVVTAFAVLFSSFSSPTLSAFMTLIAFIIGRANEDLYFFAKLIVRRANGIENLEFGQLVTYYFSIFCAYISPNLEVFNVREAVSRLEPVAVDPFSIVYALAYAGAILSLATIIFNRRNFK